MKTTLPHPTHIPRYTGRPKCVRVHHMASIRKSNLSCFVLVRMKRTKKPINKHTHTHRLTHMHTCKQTCTHTHTSMYTLWLSSNCGFNGGNHNLWNIFEKKRKQLNWNGVIFLGKMPSRVFDKWLASYVQFLSVSFFLGSLVSLIHANKNPSYFE